MLLLPPLRSTYPPPTAKSVAKLPVREKLPPSLPNYVMVMNTLVSLSFLSTSFNISPGKDAQQFTNSTTFYAFKIHLSVLDGSSVTLLSYHKHALCWMARGNTIRKWEPRVFSATIPYTTAIKRKTCWLACCCHNHRNARSEMPPFLLSSVRLYRWIFATRRRECWV